MTNQKLLAQAVAWWTKAPAPEVVALVQRLEEASLPPPFEGDTKDFVRRAKKPSVQEVGTLCRALVGPKSADTLTRLEHAQWNDPRLSLALERLLREPPWTSDGTRPVWRQVFTMLTRLGDRRFVTLAPSLVSGWKFRDAQKEWLGKQLAAAVAELEKRPAPALPKEAIEALAKLGASAPKPKPGASDEAALLAAVYAKPADDAPRLVYADWLQERGDPRGEFLTLQFTAEKSKPQQKREGELFKKHGQQWLGKLAEVVLKTGVEYRRGFPAKVTARFRHQADVERCGALPEWATIEDMRWSFPGAASVEQEQWFFHRPPALSPRVMEVMRPGPLLASGRPCLCEELHIYFLRDEERRAFTAPAAARLFPNLKRLRVIADSLSLQAVAKSWLKAVPDVASLR